MSLSRALSLLLKKRGISQKELAERSGISPTSISLIMKDHTQPRQDTINALADALDVRPEFLSFLSIKREDVPADRREYYDFFWPQMEETFLKIFVKETSTNSPETDPKESPLKAHT